jgi:hypothetical protein
MKKLIILLTASLISLNALSLPIVPDAQAANEPQIIASSPRHQERIVFPYGAATTNRTLAFLFDKPVHATGLVDNVITVTNTDSSTPIIPSRVELFHNMLYFTSNNFTYSNTGTDYRVVINHNQILSNGDNVAMASDYIVNFTITSQNGSSPENAPAMRIEQGILTPQVIYDQEDSTATYKITVYNTGEYDFQEINLVDVLPQGFSFDRILSGNFVATPLNTNGNIIAFRAGSLLHGNEVSTTFKVNILTGTSHPQVTPGVYSSSTIGYGTFAPSGLGAGLFTTPTTSNYEDNREDDEDVTITHVTLPSTQTTTNPTTQSGSTLARPEQDPLTCLKINGAGQLSLSDVNSLIGEKRFIDFLNTTTYVQNTAVRLAKGYTDGSFGVNNTLTRFELTKMALGANCIDYTNSPVPNTFFSDVPKDQSEVSLVIGKAHAIGIINGIGDRFFPNNPVSYGEMVKILLGGGYYFRRGIPVTAQSSTLNGITDETFRQFAEHAVKMNLVTIDADKIFPQNDPVIRRYMAQAVARYVVWLKNVSPL